MYMYIFHLTSYILHVWWYARTCINLQNYVYDMTRDLIENLYEYESRLPYMYEYEYDCENTC